MNTIRRKLHQLLQPRKVNIALPEYFEVANHLQLMTERGRDQIAMELAAHGWSSFERPLPAVISAAVQLVRGAFFDVGANTGLYSLLTACSTRHVDIHAFEPYPPALVTLRKNIELNRLGSRIAVCQSALGEAPGQHPLYIPLQNHGRMESSASLNANFKAEHSEVIDIEVTTVDAYVSRLELARVGLLKIDVESTEHQVLAGGMETIAKDRPLIVLEVLHLADHLWLDAFCKQNRYSIFTLQPDRIQAQTSVSFHGDAWNQCFCPEEKLPVLKHCARKTGLKFSD